MLFYNATVEYSLFFWQAANLYLSALASSSSAYLIPAMSISTEHQIPACFYQATWKNLTSAIQWHYVDSTKSTNLYQLVESEQYHIWKEKILLILRIYVKMAEILLDEQTFQRSTTLESPQQKKVNWVPVLEPVAAGGQNRDR